MEAFKKYGKPALIVLIGLIVCLCVSILLHGFIMCVTEEPFSLDALVEIFPDCEGSEILDTLEFKDSAQTLLRKPDGTVFLLQFLKNGFLPKYQLLDVVNIPSPEAFTASTRTVMTGFPIQVVGQQSLDCTPAAAFQFGLFFQLYGMNALLLFGMGCIIWHFSLKNKKKK